MARLAHDRPTGRGRTSVGLAWLAGAACLACCLLPALIAAGLFGGVLVAGVTTWLPAVAAGLVASAAVAWTVSRSHARRCGCRPPTGAGEHCTSTDALTDEQGTIGSRL